MKIVKTILILTGVVAILFTLTSCFVKKYNVDYCGNKDVFKGACDNFCAGDRVHLEFPFIATDTDYTFYVDGEKFNPDYEEGKGYIIDFVMPDHDIKVDYKSENSMIDPEYKEDVMLIDYYHATVATVGGDGYDEIAVYEYPADKEYVKLNVYSKDDSESEENCDSYLVPSDVVDKCMEVIEKNKLRDWQKLKNPLSITGALIVCKFRDKDGSYVRVSTEAMPEDGKEKLGDVRAVLGQYIKKEYKTQ